MPISQLPLKDLHIEGGTQPRVAINEETVAEHAEALREGATFPPVVAFHDGIVYWLADGFHRFHAHRGAERDVIEVDVREGMLRDAILYSVGPFRRPRYHLGFFFTRPLTSPRGRYSICVVT